MHTVCVCVWTVGGLEEQRIFVNKLFTKVRQLVKLNAKLNVKLNVGVNENDLIGGFERTTARFSIEPLCARSLSTLSSACQCYASTYTLAMDRSG